MSDWTKSKKDLENKAKEIAKNMSGTGSSGGTSSGGPGSEVSKFLGGILGDISTKSATTQIIIGAVSGWVTGYTTLKIGKLSAILIGGSIIVFEIAHEQGLIKIDWSKVSKKIDSATDKVETAVTGHSPSWMDKAERYVDRKLDRAEDILKREKKKAIKWYSKLIGDENGPKINGLHLFLTAFAGGVAIGVATAA